MNFLIFKNLNSSKFSQLFSIIQNMSIFPKFIIYQVKICLLQHREEIMYKFRKILFFPLLILIFVLERISRPVWNFASGCLLFLVCFKVANAGVDPENISNVLRAVFWDAVLGTVAIQTLPEMFFEIFSGEE